MAVADNRLLAVIELGGYPDFTPLYREAGFQVVTVASMRKALGMLKKYAPDVVVAEFVYAPMYSTRISNLESLMAGIQSCVPHTRLIVFYEQGHAPHLDTLRGRFDFLACLHFPIKEQQLREALNRVLGRVLGRVGAP